MACTLCPDGTPGLFPERELAGFLVPTCGFLEATLPLVPADSPECEGARLFSNYCGCKVETTSPCSLCADHNPVPFPDNFLSVTPLAGLDYKPTCAVFESLTANYEEGTPECVQGRGVGILDCGCPSIHPPEDTCTACPGGIPEEFMEEPFPLVPSITCGYTQSTQYAYKQRSLDCFNLEVTAHYCGCTDGHYLYSDSNSRAQTGVLAWAPRPGAILSLIGSVAILSVALTAKRRKTMYHQTMICISFADIISSTAHFLSTWPSHKFLPGTDIPTGIFGASGGYWSCKVQGILSLLGGISYGLNFSLSIYYFLVITKGWKEHQFKRWIRFLLLGPSILIGIVMSGIAFPHIDSSASVCAFTPIPWKDKWKMFLFISVIPSTLANIGTPILTIYVCYKFVSQMNVSKKWRLSSHTASSPATTKSTHSKLAGGAAQRQSFGTMPTLRNSETSERISLRQRCRGWFAALSEDTLKGRVVRQSIFYLCAQFYVFPFLATFSILGSQYIFIYELTVFMLLIVPLQGFNNAIIFFRPRVVEWWDARKKKIEMERRKKQQQQQKQQQSQQQKQQQSKVNAEPQKKLENKAVSESVEIDNTPDTLEPDGNGGGGDDDDDDISLETKEFLQSHFYSSNDHDNEHDGHQERVSPTSASEDHVPENVLVGSYVLPTHRGSQVWKAINFSEEITDSIDEDDPPVIQERRSSLPIQQSRPSSLQPSSLRATTRQVRRHTTFALEANIIPEDLSASFAGVVDDDDYSATSA